MEEKIKENLISSFDEMAPYDFDEIMKHKLVRVETESELLGLEPEISEDHAEVRTSVSNVKAIRRGLRYLAALAAVLVLVFSAYMVDRFRITDELCLDVNPSICISLNRAGHVVKTEGMNGDGEIVVASVKKSLNGVKDPVNAVRLLVEEIGREGYFGNDSADFIISMGFSKKEKKDILDSVVKSLEEFTDKNGLQKTLIIQVYQKSKELEKKSSASAVSPGKYVFLSRIAEKTDVDVEEFKDKSVREIKEYIKSNKDFYESDDFTIIEEIPDSSAEADEKEDPAYEDEKDNKEIKNKDKDPSGNEGENEDSTASSGNNKGKSDYSKASEGKKSTDKKSAAADKKKNSSDKKSDKAADPEKKKSEGKKPDKEKDDKEKSKDKKSKDDKSSEKNKKSNKEKTDKTSQNEEPSENDVSPETGGNGVDPQSENNDPPEPEPDTEAEGSE